jgi:hypothetical protein
MGPFDAERLRRLEKESGKPGTPPRRACNPCAQQHAWGKAVIPKVKRGAIRRVVQAQQLLECCAARLLGRQQSPRKALPQQASHLDRKALSGPFDDYATVYSNTSG